MKKFKVVAIAMMLIVAATLSGCGKKYTTEDAKAYVQAVLDASYKGEFDEYVKLTDSTEEEAQRIYQENIDKTMKDAGLHTLGLSDELTEQYKNLFLDLAKCANYEVTDATETEDGFDVTVTASAFTGMDGMEEKLIDDLTDKVMNMKEMPSDEEITTMTFEAMYDFMKECIDNPQYEGSETITLHITKDDDGLYTVNEAEMTALDNALFPMEM